MTPDWPWEPKLVPGTSSYIDSSITAAELCELQRLARGRVVLEIGTCFGYSAVCMARAGAKHIVALDPHMEERDGIPGSYRAMRKNLQWHQVEDRVSMLLAWSQVALPMLDGLGAKFEFVFVDADHSEEMCRHDTKSAFRLLRPGGAVAVHDYNASQHPGVQLALDTAFPQGPTSVADSLWVYETQPHPFPLTPNMATGSP